jgi:hypothetical protein
MRKSLRVWLAFAALLCCAWLHATPTAAQTASVTTDKTEYAIGETVVITGSGWQAGETVELVIHEDPTVNPDVTLSATADADGNISNSDFVVPDHSGFLTFTVTATGQSSGLTAQTTFTATALFTATISPTTAGEGIATVYTVTVTNTSTASEVMHCVRITVPTGETITAGSLSVVATDPGPTTRTWDTPTVSSGIIQTTRSGGSTNGIDPTGTVVITFTSTASTDGLKTWTTSAFTNNGCTTAMSISGSQPSVTVTGAPTSNAGADATTCAGEAINLDGTASGGDGSYTFAWTVQSGPNTSSAQFSNAAIEDPTFTPTASGTYTLRFTVDDGVSAPVFDEVEITVNDAVSVNAGSDATTCENEALSLAATVSGGDGSYTFAWTVESGPNTSPTQFSDATIEDPSFTPTATGTYVLRLTVDDGICDAQFDEVEITVNDAVSVNAGSDAMTCVGLATNLAATVTGGDGTYTFAWTVESGPDLSAAQFSDATIEDPTFTPTALGTYVLRLTADDGVCAAAFDEVEIEVKEVIMVNAGSDASTCASEALALAATVSGGDGTYTFAWTVESGPNTSATQFSDATIEDPSFTPTASGTYTLRLTVDDGVCPTAFDEVEITVNDAVSVDAGSDAGVALGNSTNLNGTPSGGDGTYTFAWTVQSGPDLSASQFSDATIEDPSFTPTALGTYVLRVTIDDGVCAPAFDEVTIDVTPAVVSKPYVFVAESKITLKRTKQTTPAGNIHSNGTIKVDRGDDPSTYNSTFTAVGKISIEKHNVINGDVTSATSVSNASTVNGTVSVGAVSTVALPSLSYSAGATNVTVPKSGSTTLAPGSYGNVILSERSTLKLTSGEYFFNELRYASSKVIYGTIEIDLSSGMPITLNIVSSFYLDHDAAFRLLPNGEGDSELVTVNTLQSSNVNLGREAFLLGNFNAPNAKVTLLKNSQLRGTICAKEILVDRDCLFFQHDSPGTLPGPDNMHKSAADDDEEEEVASDQSTVTSYELAQNYPNPFNPSTTISFALPEAGEVTLTIFNLQGQRVAQLASGRFESGRHEVTWHAVDERGQAVSSGVYIYVLKAGSFVSKNKLVLMK